MNAACMACRSSGCTSAAGATPIRSCGDRSRIELRRRAGEADAPVRRMARDEVHRIVGEKAVHRGAFGGGKIGGMLTILRRRGDERGLHDGGQNGQRVDLPDRDRQARDRQRTHRLYRGNDGKRDGGSDGSAQDGRPSACERGFGGHQREPDNERRQHAAGQRGEIADEGREQRNADRSRAPAATCA